MNLLYIFSDQHAKLMSGCYGNPYVHTPNLDRLAKRGVRFDNAYCNNPLCAPSRASMVTGEYPHKGGFWENAHAYVGEQKSFGHRLEENNVRVTTIGKLHFKDTSDATGFLDQRIPLHVKNGIGDPTHCINDDRLRKESLRDVILDAEGGNSDYIEFDEKISELALDYLDKAKDNKDPWCLYLGYVTPHYPLIAPPEILELYKPFDKLPLPVDWDIENRPHHPIIDRFRKVFCFEDEFSVDSIRKAVACYYALCTFVDKQIGIVLDKLDELGLSENTRIIYSTDHGEMMGNHGLFFKELFYEESVAVPLIVAGPGLPKGEVVENVVSLVDIYQTVLENFGIELNDDDKTRPGTSLYAFADGRCTEERPVLAEIHCGGYGTSAYMVRYGRYKYIYYVGSVPQLFDLKLDPHERCDLGTDPEYADVIKDMHKALLTQIADPDEMTRICKAEQARIVEEHGGFEVLRSKTLAFSPVPKN